jgi:hypothetical protein
VNVFKIGNRELHIEPSKIYWENQLFDNLIEQPTEIRYGIAPIELDMFNIGTNFKIQLQNEKNDRLNISLKSYFGIDRSKKHQLYEQIADAIWDNFFAVPFAELVEKWENGKTIEVANFLIDLNGITKKLGPHNITMNFDEMKLFPRFDHLLINSKVKTHKFMKLHYLDHWNWPLVNEIINRAVNEKE